MTKYNLYVEDYNIPLSPWYIINEASLPYVSKFTKGAVSLDAIMIFKKDYVRWGANKKQFIDAGNYFNDLIFKDNKYMNGIANKHYYYFREIIKFIRTIKMQKFDTLPDNKLYELHERFYMLYSRCWAWGSVYQFMDMGDIKYSDTVKKRIGKRLNIEKNLEIIFSKLITPLKISYFGKENNAVLELLNKIQKDKTIFNNFQKSNSIKDINDNLAGKIKLLAKQFGWLQYYYKGPDANENYYYKLLKSKMNLNTEIELISIKQDRKDLINFQNKYKKILPEKDIFELKVLRDSLFLKESRKEIQVYMLSSAMDLWYQEFSRRINIDKQLCRYLFKDEIKKILLEGKKINSKILRERSDYCVYIIEKNKNQFYSGNKARKFESLLTKETIIDDQLQSLKGSVAFIGKAKGKVKIVNATSDIAKVEPGDILVSYATNPSLVPAMNLAGAIVTDTGGITCHAAIVSRELKIPCIVGTKIATQVFKDGDIVEVDAERGVVKIIERSSEHSRRANKGVLNN